MRQRERETERQSTNGRGAENERETQNLKQASGSELSAESDMGLEPMNREIMTRAEVEPPRHPSFLIFKIDF